MEVRFLSKMGSLSFIQVSLAALWRINCRKSRVEVGEQVVGYCGILGKTFWGLDFGSSGTDGEFKHEV